MRNRTSFALALLLPALASAAQSPSWSSLREFYCTPGKAFANAADDPLIVPTKLFDDLYVIGRNGTVVYVLDTRDGLVLIDAGYPDQLDTVLLPGLKALGLDPARIRLVLVTHGHADHFGGSKALAERYGTKIAASAIDWATIDKPGADGAPQIGPHRDVVLVDGEAVTVGGVSLTPVLVPGHTPGSLGFVFPVHDRGTRHVAALFGGMILLPQRVADIAGLQVFVDSLTKFGAVAKRLGADVEVQNHPLFDDFEARLAQVRARPAGGAHPFVVGSAGYQAFIETVASCMTTEAARRTARSAQATPAPTR